MFLLQNLQTSPHTLIIYNNNSKYAISFRFPSGWPSHIHSLAVFPCEIPILNNWLQQRNLDSVYHPICNCHLYDSGYLQCHAVSTWYLRICPWKYPYELYKYTQNILIVDLDDKILVNCLKHSDILELMSCLTNLEYYIYDKFHTFLSFPITMFQFVRYSKMSESIWHGTQ